MSCLPSPLKSARVTMRPLSRETPSLTLATPPDCPSSSADSATGAASVLPAVPDRSAPRRTPSLRKQSTSGLIVRARRRSTGCPGAPRQQAGTLHRSSIPYTCWCRCRSRRRNELRPGTGSRAPCRRRALRRRSTFRCMQHHRHRVEGCTALAARAHVTRGAEEPFFTGSVVVVGPTRGIAGGIANQAGVVGGECSGRDALPPARSSRSASNRSSASKARERRALR
jgi:hypothetical protein